MRGILCNLLVCLAVWCNYKLKTEIAKLAMILAVFFHLLRLDLSIVLLI